MAALLPWLVHLIGNRRALPVRFAAMQLLMRAERRISARRRLREILLLVARTGVAAALPLVFARPFAKRTTDVPVASLDPQSAVIVLDDSASMAGSPNKPVCLGMRHPKSLAPDTAPDTTGGVALPGVVGADDLDGQAPHSTWRLGRWLAWMDAMTS